MNCRAFFLVVLVAAGSLPNVSFAQEHQTPNTLKADSHSPRPKAKIADLAWLEGHWVGEGLGGTCEEVWTPPLGNNMMGMFRLVKNEKVVFSELLFIVESEGSLVLKLKHFDTDFKGWEEKDQAQSFPLVKSATNVAYFDGLTIRKREDGTLQAFVAIKLKSGEIKEEEFRYSSAKK
jgi:hypothetical protein